MLSKLKSTSIQDLSIHAIGGLIGLHLTLKVYAYIANHPLYEILPVEETVEITTIILFSGSCTYFGATTLSAIVALANRKLSKHINNEPNMRRI